MSPAPDAARHDVVLFSQGWCEFSEMVRLHLESRGQPYTERDIDIDQEARGEMIRLGGAATPVVVIDGEVIIGYDDHAMDELLGFQPYNEREDYANPLVDEI